jgi:tetratricopeptide (TPR) repeat protein
MSMRSLSVRGAAALLAAGLLACPALPKPPDLPVDYQDTFAPPEAVRPDTPAAPSAPGQADTSEEVMRLLTARRMFRIGERCLRKGNLDMAYNCFQEVHLLAPTSRYGQLAIDRLSKIDQRRLAETDSAEQQESASQEGQNNAASQLDQARQLFRIGERCRKKGELDMAINCYREVQLLCPGSVYARRARQRIADIKHQRTTDEPAEPGLEQHSPPADSQDNSAGSPEARISKPQLEIIEQNSAPLDNVSAPTLRLPLYVNPPVRRLVIEQVYPQNRDE